MASTAMGTITMPGDENYRNDGTDRNVRPIIQCTAVLCDDGTADRKAEARAVRFGRPEWIEQARDDARGDPGAAVTHGYLHLSVAGPGSAHHDLTRFVRGLGK